MLEPERSWAATKDYRYGYNGKERDDAIKEDYNPVGIDQHMRAGCFFNYEGGISPLTRKRVEAPCRLEFDEKTMKHIIENVPEIENKDEKVH